MKFCPATMCPLFAKNGSPWTDHKNSPCPEDNVKCAWWNKRCDGCSGAFSQIEEAAEDKIVFQVGPKRGRKKLKPQMFDCPRANECQWQAQSKGLCPPRLALSMGIDPRYCAY